MTNFNFTEIFKELNVVEETGVTFEGKGRKWDTESEVQEVIDEIEKCHNLVYLNLEGNTLGADASKSVGRVLEKHPEFKKALWKDLFTSRSKKEIPAALKNMGAGIILAGAQITVLDCSDNALGPNGMVGLVDLLKSSACYSLKELKLNNCGLGIGGGKMLSEALLACYKKSMESSENKFSLKVFIAGRNRLENEGAKALAKVFTALKTLEEIAIPQNGIYHEGIRALSEALKENKNMQTLNLNDNTITPKGAEHLAEAFLSMQKLKDINFGDCLLKTRGALLLIDALQPGHTDLEEINLGYNEIGPDGGLGVVTAMSTKPYLQSILLNGNQFGCDGRENIKEIMSEFVNPNALGSLSEDESDVGEEEEDDTECDDGEDVDDEEDVSTEDDGNDIEYVSTSGLETTFENSDLSTTNNNDDNSIFFAGEEERPNTIETFCNTPNPSLKMFNDLEEKDKIDAFRNYLKIFQDEEYLLKLIFTILKCSAISEESKDAMDVSTALYSDAFNYAKEKNQITRVRTFFLIQLGLLKSENKTFKPQYNLNACRHVMKKAIDQKLFPEEIENTFKLFLERFG